jgi:hypothetical protein
MLETLEPQVGKFPTSMVLNLADLNREPFTGKVKVVTFETAGEQVNIDLRNLTLNIFSDGCDVYYIDLEQCLTSSQVLDWIAQLEGKAWVSVSLLGLIAKVLCIALDPQANLCSFGHNIEIKQSKIKGLVEANIRTAIAWQEEHKREGIYITWL